MINNMMDGSMMGGIGILIFLVALLAAAALIKYLFFGTRRDN